MSTPFLREFVREIDANLVSFLQGGLSGLAVSQSMENDCIFVGIVGHSKAARFSASGENPQSSIIGSHSALVMCVNPTFF